MTEEQRQRAKKNLNSPESIAKRKKTMAERYSQSDRSEWGRKGGQSGRHDIKGFGAQGLGPDGLTGHQRASLAGSVRKGETYDIASHCCSAKFTETRHCSECGENCSPVKLDD